MRLTSSVDIELIGTTTSRRGQPRVRVPVLSNTTILPVANDSKAFMRIGSIPMSVIRAAVSVIATGVASAKAHGQVTISTATRL